MAEGVFRSLTMSNPRIGVIDSAGTGAYHTLEPPDCRTMDTLGKHGISDYNHGARQVELEDFENFDYIFAMDKSNLQSLQRMQRRLEQKGGQSKAQVSLFGAYGARSKSETVVDPYYGEDNGFETVYEQVCRFSKNFLREFVDNTDAAPAQSS